MHEMFVPSAALAVKRPLTDSMDPGRYDSELAELNGTIAEIYETLPDDMHDQLETSIPFRNLVSNTLLIAVWDSPCRCSVPQAVKFESKKHHPPVSFWYCSGNLWASDPILQSQFQLRGGARIPGVDEVSNG